MTKWANYLISAVKYDDDHKHITHLKVHEDKGDKVGERQSYSRQKVVDAINSGTTFITIYKENKTWQKGQKVFVIEVNGVSYLKTVDNKKEEDNLENLPEF